MIGIEVYEPHPMLFGAVQMAKQPPNATGVIRLPSHLSSQATTFTYQATMTNLGGQNLHYEATIDQSYRFTQQTNGGGGGRTTIKRMSPRVPFYHS